MNIYIYIYVCIYIYTYISVHTYSKYRPMDWGTCFKLGIRKQKCSSICHKIMCIPNKRPLRVVETKRAITKTKLP